MDTTFVPARLDCSRFENLSPLFDRLLARPVSSRAELERWLLDRSELAAACSQERANLYISMTCDTENAEKSAAYAAFVEDVDPRLKPVFFELDKRLVELAERVGLSVAPGERFHVLWRDARAEVALFREENIPLQTSLALLGQTFEQLVGSLTVMFEGQEKTLPQMAKYQEMPDRPLRESAWRTVAERRRAEVGTLNGIYDEMIALRTKLALNAGFEHYVGYAFSAMHRFDYGVRECAAFHEGVAQHAVPFARTLDAKRARALGASPLRPWDLSVDERGRGPLKPFAGGQELMAKSTAAMRSLDPRLGEMLASLGDGTESRGAQGGACLDLDSRKGKAPSGYQYMRDRSRRPFIFMNAAGLHKDVETMVHEAGHAFHSMVCVDEPLVEYRASPIEFAEVASMGMELLSMKHWAAGGSFYEGKQEDFRRACREQLKRSVSLLPWIATIDAFQHWVYSNPDHTREQREQHWLTLDDRFGPAVSWEGLGQYRPNTWQRQMHLFSNPFYYIEYGIAQLGALQLWLLGIEHGERAAIDAYFKGLSLGGSKPLPELFAASGLDFDFGGSTIARLVERVARELESMPE